MDIHFISYNSEFELETNLSVEEFTHHLFQVAKPEFDRAHIKSVVEASNSIEFKGTPFRFAWNGWNRYNGISSGKILVERVGNYLYITNHISITEC